MNMRKKKRMKTARTIMTPIINIIPIFSSIFPFLAIAYVPLYASIALSSELSTLFLIPK